MVTKTTAPFIASSRRYAKAAVKKANANKNRYLTKAEAKKLPKDLRDNFANFRARGTKNGSVVAADFTRRYGDYVEAVVKKADKNSSGVLSNAEVATLPTDVRDNFKNFWSTDAGGGAPVAELQTAKERTDALYNRQLPAASALGKLTKQMDQQLADGNIMTGVVGLASGKLKNPGATDAELAAWGTALMGDYLAVTDDGAKAEGVTVRQLSAAKAVDRAGLILAEGNAYDTSNPENIEGLVEGSGSPDDEDEYIIGIKDVNEQLGSPLKSFVVNGRRKDDEGGYDKVGLAVFLNTKTGDFVAYYGREGHV